MQPIVRPPGFRSQSRSQPTTDTSNSQWTPVGGPRKSGFVNRSDSGTDAAERTKGRAAEPAAQNVRTVSGEIPRGPSADLVPAGGFGSVNDRQKIRVPESAWRFTPPAPNENVSPDLARTREVLRGQDAGRFPNAPSAANDLPSNRPRVRFVTPANPPDDASDPSAMPRRNGNYAYDPTYRWLQGRLEYRRSDRQWVLRYIPLEGETDPYGGSVELEEHPSLDRLHEGDFVRIQGQMIRREPRPAGFAGHYAVDSLDVLR